MLYRWQTAESSRARARAEERAARAAREEARAAEAAAAAAARAEEAAAAAKAEEAAVAAAARAAAEAAAKQESAAQRDAREAYLAAQRRAAQAEMQRVQAEAEAEAEAQVKAARAGSARARRPKNPYLDPLVLLRVPPCGCLLAGEHRTCGSGRPLQSFLSPVTPFQPCKAQRAAHLQALLTICTSRPSAEGDPASEEASAAAAAAEREEAAARELQQRRDEEVARRLQDAELAQSATGSAAEEARHPQWQTAVLDADLVTATFLCWHVWLWSQCSPCDSLPPFLTSA